MLEKTSLCIRHSMALFYLTENLALKTKRRVVFTRNPVTEWRLYKSYIRCAANNTTAVNSVFTPHLFLAFKFVSLFHVGQQYTRSCSESNIV
jgi:hypothetical protein